MKIIFLLSIITVIGLSYAASIDVLSSELGVYESYGNPQIEIKGSGFTKDMLLGLVGMSGGTDIPYVLNVDYTMAYVSSSSVKLSFVPGKSWKITPNFGGDIRVRYITIAGTNYPFPGSDKKGVRVATVIEEPTITGRTYDERRETSGDIRETQSKVLGLLGSALHNVDKMTLIPTFPSAFNVVEEHTYNVKSLRLKDGHSWLPAAMSLKDKPDGTRIPLQVYSLFTIAGEYILPKPVTIVHVIKDPPGYVCDDSCVYSFNWRCEDPSMHNYRPDDYTTKCPKGTDCTDCGGIEVLVPTSSPTVPPGFCDNSCIYRKNGKCDDPRGSGNCDIGTDCDDCGPVPADYYAKLPKVTPQKQYVSSTFIISNNGSFIESSKRENIVFNSGSGIQFSHDNASFDSLYTLTKLCLVLVLITLLMSLCLYCKLYRMTQKTNKVKKFFVRAHEVV